MISKVKQLAQKTGLKIKNPENMRKSKWKKTIEERTKQEMVNKTKARTIVEDKWKRKTYLVIVIQ